MATVIKRPEIPPGPRRVFKIRKGPAIEIENIYPVPYMYDGRNLVLKASGNAKLYSFPYGLHVRVI